MKVENKKYYIPQEIKNLLLTSRNNFDSQNRTKKTQGYSVLDYISDNKTITGVYLKKIKHYMEHNEDSFFLLGGQKMLNWINSVLDNKREANNRMKKAKSEAGIKNSYIRPHEKNKEFSKVKIPSLTEIFNNYI